MAADQYYEQVAGDDSADPLVGEGSSSRVVRAPPTQGKTALTKFAYFAIAVTVFLAAVAVVSSAVVSYRLPAATEAALAKQNMTASVTPAATSSSDKTTGMGMGDVEGMDTSTTPDNKDHVNSYKTGTADAPLISLNSSHHQSLKSCGGTPDEARAAGCVFDVMMQLWTPPECMDTSLSERFLEAGNWTWYANIDASRIYTDEEIRKGNHDVVYVAQSYHRHHCIFAWERLVRAMRNQAPLIEELISYDHVMHCRHKTLTLPEEGAEQVRGVVAPTGYTKCASYDVWIQNLPYNKMSSTD